MTTTTAPAKINLGLFVGPARESDGRHELATVMQSISLADEVTLEQGAAGAECDEVVCPGVAGAPEENLAASALRAFRAATGWRAPPVRVSIVKRIPVAAGLGGGSADAAATLRLARRASGLGDERLLWELACELGADVPAQVSPGRWLATGAGERLEPLAAPAAPFGVLVLPLDGALSTAAVYGEADRLACWRPADELAELRDALRAALQSGAPLPADARLLDNDLQAPAVSLCPAIGAALEEASGAGARHALVSGSGPTVLGLFADPAGAGAAAAALSARSPAPIAAKPVGMPVGE
jgi:4-diphosphocytidyl-2-C-methyl-D-erythritol kinase